MTMTEKLQNDFRRSLGDARVRSISWDNNDVVFDLLCSAAPQLPRKLRLRAVSRVRIDMDFGDYVGLPLVYSGAVRGLDRGHWAVQIDFGAAPEGGFACECVGIDWE
jgi:hypothetical protein